MDQVNGAANIKGRVRPYHVLGGGQWEKQTDWCDNAVLYDWGAAAARMLTQLGANYRISGMYLEYKNVASPTDVISPPVFGRDGARAYYNGLASSPNVDYLRLPLVATTLDSSDPNTFADVNRMTFFALSQGTVGANGKAFSDSVNSKVYGGALVAIVNLADRTQDVIFSRFYFPTSKQQIKLATSQIGMEWQLALV